jgi:hypothetical protein
LKGLTKRDMAILGGFLVVVVVASLLLIRGQVSGSAPASADDTVLSEATLMKVPDTPIVASGGLTLDGSDIADPKAFEPAKQALPGIFQAAINAGKGGIGSPKGGEGTPAGTGQGGPSGAGPTGPGGPRGRGGPGGPGGGGPGPQAQGEARIYIAALVGEGDSIRALVVQKESGDTRWIGAGESAFGYTLEYATMKGAVVGRNGQHYVLPLGKGATSRSQSAGPGASGGGESGPDTGPAPEGSAAEKLIGTWVGNVQGMNITLNYNKGGSGSVVVPQMPQPMNFRWSVNGNTIHTSMQFGGMSQEDDINFRFEGDRTLILSGGRMGGMGEMRMTKR